VLPVLPVVTWGKISDLSGREFEYIVTGRGECTLYDKSTALLKTVRDPNASRDDAKAAASQWLDLINKFIAAVVMFGEGRAVHLDVKPDNALYMRDGRVVLVDLDGCLLGEAGKPAVWPAHGGYLRSPAYRQPKCLQPSLETLDVSADRWSCFQSILFLMGIIVSSEQLLLVAQDQEGLSKHVCQLVLRHLRASYPVLACEHGDEVTSAVMSIMALGMASRPAVKVKPHAA
jgi:hypothetical protein